MSPSTAPYQQNLIFDLLSPVSKLKRQLLHLLLQSPAESLQLFGLLPAVKEQRLTTFPIISKLQAQSSIVPLKR